MQAAGRQRYSAAVKAEAPENGGVLPKGKDAGIKLVSRAMVGSGVAGMTAALGIADQGFKVELMEVGEKLEGNLTLAGPGGDDTMRSFSQRWKRFCSGV